MKKKLFLALHWSLKCYSLSWQAEARPCFQTHFSDAVHESPPATAWFLSTHTSQNPSQITIIYMTCLCMYVCVIRGQHSSNLCSKENAEAATVSTPSRRILGLLKNSPRQFLKSQFKKKTLDFYLKHGSPGFTTHGKPS